MTKATIPTVLAARADERPDAVALTGVVDERGGVDLTYGAWRDRAARVGAALEAARIGRGDRVVVTWAGDWITYAVAYMGVLWAGATAVPVDVRGGGSRAAEIATQCGAVAIVGADVSGASCPAWACAELEEHAGPISAVAAAHPDDIAEVLHTSGTTGRPKPVEATHTNVLWLPERMTRAAVVVHALPAGSNAGQSLMMQALAQPHIRTVALSRFTADAYVAAIRDYRATVAVVAPLHATELAHRVDRGIEPDDLSSLRLVRSVGAATAPATLHRLARACPAASVVDFYTSTEAWPAYVRARLDPARPGSLGRVDPEQVRIVDDAGREVAAGEVGHIHLRSAAPPRSSDGVSLAGRAGWIPTGDLGRLDPDGYLYLGGRADEVILAGGVRVDPARVDAALEAHPDVRQACTVGPPSPTLGQYVACAILLRPGATTTTDELATWAAQRLSAAEVPRITIVDDLPRTTTGKPIRREVIEMLTTRRPTTQPTDAGEEDEGARLLEDVGRIWTDVLELDADLVSPESDWMDIGGSSITAPQVTHLVRQVTGRDIGVRDLRHSRSLREYVERVQAAAPLHPVGQGE
jgi:acyl-CoA synthetase (AMP-forming)/AMP-acid ligase II